MTNSFIEISVQELAKKLQSDATFTILDVREAWELEYARLDNPRVLHIPMSVLATNRQQAFPEELRHPQAEIIVMCHHGMRSASVAAWMVNNGWKNISSLAGGIDAYAAEIDPGAGSY